MGYDAGGPSGMQLYRNAGGQGTFPDTGQAMGAGLMDSELAHRAHYAEPSQFNQEAQPVGAPNEYNYQQALPVKYSVPTPAKDRMNARQAVRNATGAARIDPISDEEISYLQSMKDQAELADFDRYVNTLVDPRKPGNLKWLMEIYPEFVNRRIQQVHTDYEYALRNQMIDSWGINTFDDLHFKYLVDQKKINGPNLARVGNAASQYAPGFLSPLHWDTRRLGLFLPFDSARIGKRPDNPGEWQLGDAGQPMGRGRIGGYPELASGMYDRQAVIDNDGFGGAPNPIPVP